MERAKCATEPVTVEYRVPVRETHRAGSCPADGPVLGDRGAGPVDGGLDGHQRAQARPGGVRASEARLETGAELAGLAFYEVDFVKGVAYVDERLRDLCGVPPDREQGLGALEFWTEHLHPDDRPRVLDERGRLHEGTVQRLSIEYRYLHPDRGRDGSSTWPWPQRVTGRPRRPDLRRPPRHHRAQAHRRGAARAEPAPDRGPRGGARPARARAARRREPAARGPGHRCRSRRAGAAGRGRTRRRCGQSARASCASARTSTPWHTSCTLRSSRSWASSRRCGRSASGGARQGPLELSVDLEPLPAVVGRTRRSACSGSRRRR